MMGKVANAKPVAVYDTNAQTRTRVCENFGIEKNYADYQEMLRDEEIDVVYVATPNVFHKDQVIAAANAGKHVFCQKPMGMNAQESEQMVEACNANHVQLGMGFCYRYQAGQAKVKELLQAGAIGAVSYYHFSFNLGGYNPETAGWRCNPKLAGGGPLMDLAPHLVDLLLYFSDEEVRSVMAYVAPEKTPEQIDLDAHAVLELASGARAAMDVSFVRGNIHNYTIVGRKGQIRAMGTMCWNNELDGIGKGKVFLEPFMDSHEVEYGVIEQLEEEVRRFTASIQNNLENPVNGAYGLKVQRIIDAIYESGKTGKRVTLTL